MTVEAVRTAQVYNRDDANWINDSGGRHQLELQPMG